MIRICDSRECTTENKNGSGPCVNPTVTYAGATLGTYERNGYDDSDFYAIVWDDETQSIKDVEYASTRGWTYHNHASVDATPEVLDKARVWFANFLLTLWLSEAAEEAATPVKGDRVRSLTTRGKNVGVEGVVMWRGESRSAYGTWSHGWRLGIRVEGRDKLSYVDSERVEILSDKSVTEDKIDELTELAWTRAQTTNFRRG